jgi:glycosyltransferase involved in cell wall biosynthesis
MLISVLINNYNYGEYINACIDSCLEQSLINKEVIVVDDGSVDNSRSIILGYGSSIKYIFKQNGGQASAFNAGFLACTGDVIVFLDSDDMLMPHCLDKIAQNWNISYSKLHFNLLMIGKNYGPRGEIFCKGSLPHGELKELILKEGNHVSMPTSGNAFSRAFLSGVMPMPEAAYRTCADVYVTNLAPMAGCVGAIDEPLGFYRMHDKNISSLVMNSRFKPEELYRNIVREITTDGIIDDFSNRIGLEYNTGALINSYAHLQQVMVYDKLANLFGNTRFRTPLKDYISLSFAIFRLKNMPYYKIALIHSWMFLLLVAPATIAERMVIFGYKRKAMLACPRMA